MFKKKINNKSYVVGEPTLRQDKAFIKICSEQNINFTEVNDGVDLGEILLSGAKGNNLEKLLSIMIHEEGKIWTESGNSGILEELSDLTETEIEEIASEFFLKKKVWSSGLMSILEGYFLKLLLALTKKKRISE